MQDFEKLGIFYLGRHYDLANRKPLDSPVLYESRDLVTHGVCVGMTGSGKTGLCLSLLEEAAMDSIPALIIDPKGDLGNLLLTFPDLKPDDFLPWVNEDDARRKGLSTQEFARQQAELWQKGLAAWGQDGQRIANLRRNCDFAIYTPGSDAGIPVSVVRSFAAPPPELVEDRELFRERVSATATALLGLLGINADPIQSREHILISTLLDQAWRNGQDLDLPALISQIQAPPLARIGVLETEAFYPSKDRFQLAMMLNNLLASPGFEAWLEGEPLDVQSLLYDAHGKPRMSILSIAHLNDSERMFFVSLLLNQTLSWMRQQSGTTSLRALLYMDEIFGYLPPIGEPPSKRPFLTLLKQARAFGLGVVLATQNPVDLDYKALSNAGTWWIGRLQTERDKNRVLDGLEGVAASAGLSGGFDRQKIDQMLSGLGNRIFLMNNVHRGAPIVFETRWAMSYLRGPLTRSQIRMLMQGRKPVVAGPSGAALKSRATNSSDGASAIRPVLPPDVPQYFVPARSGGAVVYAPKLFACADVKFLDPKRQIDLDRKIALLAPITSDATPISWEDAEESELEAGDLEQAPAEGARFLPLPPAAGKAKNYASWSRDFANWLYANQRLDLFYSPSTGETSKPEESERDFRIRLQTVAREQRDAAVTELRKKYETKLRTLEDKIRRAEQLLRKEKQESQSELISSVISIGTSIFGALLGSRKTSTALGKATGAIKGVNRIRKQSQQAGFAEDNLENLQAQYEELQQQIEQESEALAAQYDVANEQFETFTVRPKKTHIAVKLCALVWTPQEREEV
ncbi:MAG: hypothetical protein NZV14_18160 [Bryobacteraceae bacterium]|nr:hypothetical protein [Bryobacteraceae bacterium]MDW8380090.1 hypothetical protein [Bryobacterales bacterium]